MKTNSDAWPITVDTEELIRPLESYWVATPDTVRLLQIRKVIVDYDANFGTNTTYIVATEGTWNSHSRNDYDRIVEFATTFEAAHAEWTKMQQEEREQRIRESEGSPDV